MIDFKAYKSERLKFLVNVKLSPAYALKMSAELSVAQVLTNTLILWLYQSTAHFFFSAQFNECYDCL